MERYWIARSVRFVLNESLKSWRATAAGGDGQLFIVRLQTNKQMGSLNSYSLEIVPIFLGEDKCSLSGRIRAPPPSQILFKWKVDVKNLDEDQEVWPHTIPLEKPEIQKFTAEDKAGKELYTTLERSRDPRHTVLNIHLKERFLASVKIDEVTPNSDDILEMFMSICDKEFSSGDNSGIEKIEEGWEITVGEKHYLARVLNDEVKYFEITEDIPDQFRYQYSTPISAYCGFFDTVSYRIYYYEDYIQSKHEVEEYEVTHRLPESAQVFTRTPEAVEKVIDSSKTVTWGFSRSGEGASRNKFSLSWGTRNIPFLVSAFITTFLGLIGGVLAQRAVPSNIFAIIFLITVIAVIIILIDNKFRL